MITFVVLHYNSISDTENCINSILGHLSHEAINIIVVDNNSPNNSGKKIKELYDQNNIVTILLNNENLGFSKGNNIGCDFAIKNFDPDFICIINNDTYIDDNDFVKKIKLIYSSNNFDALGTKIWNTHRQFNQNPFKVIASIDDVNKGLLFYSRAEKFLNSILPISYYFFFKFFSRKANYHTDGLHGAAIIFSKKYFTRFQTIFPEITFLYGEEHFLHYRKIKNNLKFIFDFNLTIYHNHSSSTRITSKNVIHKWRFQHELIKKSLNELKKIYLQNNNI